MLLAVETVAAEEVEFSMAEVGAYDLGGRCVRCRGVHGQGGIAGDSGTHENGIDI